MRTKVADAVRSALYGRTMALGTEQLTALMLVLAERVDRLEDLVLTGAEDGGEVNLIETLTNATRRHPVATEPTAEQVREEIADHELDLKAQQHAYTCRSCGKTLLAGEDCLPCTRSKR